MAISLSLYLSIFLSLYLSISLSLCAYVSVMVIVSRAGSYRVVHWRANVGLSHRIL